MYIPVGVVVHSHHIALLDDTVLLREILFGKRLAPGKPSVLIQYNQQDPKPKETENQYWLGGLWSLAIMFLFPSKQRREEQEKREEGRRKLTVWSLDSPIFLPMRSFIHFDVLSSPPLDCRPGTTRGILIEVGTCSSLVLLGKMIQRFLDRSKSCWLGSSR